VVGYGEAALPVVTGARPICILVIYRPSREGYLFLFPSRSATELMCRREDVDGAVVVPVKRFRKLLRLRE